MPHHIYTTPGFIIHSAPHGESGKFFLIFTRDLGMIGVTAQGVRLSASKLRYYTQDYSYSLFSVVRGKDVWRMTGSKEIDGIDKIGEKNIKLLVRVLGLLKRLLTGEEKNEKLFSIIEYFFIYLSKNDLDKEEKEIIEYLTVLRILNNLGYIHTPGFEKYMSEVIDETIFEMVRNEKKNIINAINKGLKESQL